MLALASEQWLGLVFTHVHKYVDQCTIYFTMEDIFYLVYLGSNIGNFEQSMYGQIYNNLVATFLSFYLLVFLDSLETGKRVPN